MNWYDYSQELFFNIDGLLVEARIAQNAPNLAWTGVGLVGPHPVRIKTFDVFVPGSTYTIQLRAQTSDVAVFGQIFVGREYDHPDLPKSVYTIVDLGANIGLATVFFAMKYPQAEILSVEPDPANFSQLLKNTTALGDRVKAREVAVWNKDGYVSLINEDSEGREVDAWAIQVSEQEGRQANAGAAQVPCRSVLSLISDVKFDHIDILKVDIEGGELDLFSSDASKWLSRTSMVIIETHDRFRPGSEAAVRDALRSKFQELPRSGELLFFRRTEAEKAKLSHPAQYATGWR